MNKIFALVFSISLFSCSSFVRRSFESQEDYYQSINKELESKSVLVHVKNNENKTGKFIKINSSSVFIISTDTLELSTENVYSISYKTITPDWFVGAFVGLSVGAGAFLISGAKIDFGGNSKYPYMIYAIPGCTFVGSIIGGIESDNYKTFVINKEK